MEKNEYRLIGEKIIDDLKDSIRSTLKMYESRHLQPDEAATKIQNFNEQIEAVEKGLSYVDKRVAVTTARQVRGLT